MLNNFLPAYFLYSSVVPGGQGLEPNHFGVLPKYRAP